MKNDAKSVEDYIVKVPEPFNEGFGKLRETVLNNISAGFEEALSYGMIGYVVPFSIYPDGYHCNTSLPLPFLNIAAQKNFIAYYHMGLYANPELLNWFVEEYNGLNIGKLDMGKSCIRFRKPDKIPFDLMGELSAKVTLQQWISWYETALKKKK